MKFNFRTIALPFSIEKIEMESGEGMIRIAFLIIHLDIKYHKNWEVDKMRLIDADEFKKALVKHFDAYFNENGRLMYSDHICTSDDVIDLFNFIDKQPTAYDVDTVVNQLELHSFSLGITELPAFYVRLNDAIKIVKGGGVDE